MADGCTIEDTAMWMLLQLGLTLNSFGEVAIVDDSDEESAEEDDEDDDSSKAKSNAALIGTAVGCVLAAVAVIFVVAIVVYNKTKKYVTVARLLALKMTQTYLETSIVFIIFIFMKCSVYCKMEKH